MTSHPLRNATQTKDEDAQPMTWLELGEVAKTIAAPTWESRMDDWLCWAPAKVESSYRRNPEK